jgi:hypothetical protein
MTMTVRDHTPPDSGLAHQTTGHAGLTTLTEALQRYFDLMYDCDVARFEQVFLLSAHLHGFRDGQMVAWSGATYKDILAKRASPKSLGAARLDDILLIDRVSEDMAFTKVRVRIATMVFVDYLTWHRMAGQWRITSKGFHLEARDDGSD